jgi:flagellar assembly protein FliH
MTESKLNRFKHVHSVDDELEFSHWNLPDLTDDQSQGPSNMFGKKPAQHIAEESIEEEPKPMTMAQLEEMRAVAEKDGFDQGKEEGYQTGLEQGRLEGLEQGHKEGLEQGEQQGFEAGKAEADALVMRFSSIVEQFEKPLTVLDQEIESELLNLVLALTKAVIINEVKTNPEHILAALRQGINALPIKEQQIKIRVNQEDADLISQFYSQDQLDKNRWQLDVDPVLSSGDCIIDSVRSSVDLSVEERMSQVLEDLKQKSLSIETNILSNKGDDKGYTTETVDDTLPSTAQEADESVQGLESAAPLDKDTPVPKTAEVIEEVDTANTSEVDTANTSEVDISEQLDQGEAPELATSPPQESPVGDDVVKENKDAKSSTSTPE